MQLDHIEMAVKMNSGVAFTSLDVVSSTTKGFPDVATTARGMTKNDHNYITSELSFILCFVYSEIIFQSLSRHSGTCWVYRDTGILKIMVHWRWHVKKK